MTDSEIIVDICELLQRADKELDEMREALEDMCYQYLSVRNGKLCHDFIGAGEHAFRALGWPDDGPAELPDGFLCDEPGCKAASSCGFPTETGYRRTCGTHYDAATRMT